MVIYEVNLSIDADIASDYKSWLEEHVEEILELPGFQKVYWYSRKADEEGEPKGNLCLTLHYHLKNRDALEKYLEGFAPKQRQKALDKFGDRFRASRRILYPEKVVSL